MERLSKTKQPYKTSHYQDAFTKASNFGVPSLSPQIEDYAEIFGRARVATSVPVLDLPPVEVPGISGSFQGLHFDYLEVFGGSEGKDFAVTYDELMEGTKDVTYDSSDEAWTPAQSETLSDGSEEFHNSGDGIKQFKISYNKVFHTSKDDLVNGVAHVTQLNDVHGYSFLVNETPPHKMVVTNHLKHEDFGGEKGEGKQLRKTSSCNDKPFVSVSDISLRTRPSHLPPPSRPPPNLGQKAGDSGTKSSKIKASRSFGFGETTPGDGSPPFYDVQVDASSSAAVSAAAMKDAMEKAQAKLKMAKHMKDRSKQLKIHGETSEKDSSGVKEFADNATDQEKRYGLLQDFSSKHEGNVEWKEDEEFYEVVETDDSRSLSDVGYSQRFVEQNLRNYEDRQEKRASPVILQEESNRKMKCDSAVHEKIIVEAEDFENMANVLEKDNEDEKRYRNGFCLDENRTRLEGNLEGENKKLKEATDRAETQKRLKETLEREEKEQKERENWEREEKEQKERENWEREENEKREKVSCERELEKKKLQEAMEKEENENSLRLALEEKEKKQREALQRKEKEKEKRDKETRERELEEKRLQKAIQKEEKENRLRLTLEEKEKKQREALELKEKEMRDKKAREREIEENRLQEAFEKEENEKGWKLTLEEKEKKQREARERLKKEERKKESSEREEKEKREKEAAETEAKEVRLKKSFKEKETKQREACEREEQVKGEKVACERELESNRLSVPIEQQEKEKKLNKTLGTKENGEIQELTQEINEGEKRTKEDPRWQNIEVEPNTTLEKGENKEKIKEESELKEDIQAHKVHEREDSGKRSSEDFEDEDIDKMWEEDNLLDETVASGEASNKVDKKNKLTKKTQGPFQLQDPTHIEVQSQNLNTCGVSRDGLQHKRREIRVGAAESLHMHDTVFEFDKKPFKRTSNIVKVSVVDDLGEKGVNQKIRVGKDKREDTCITSQEVKEKVWNQKGEQKGKHLDEVLNREKIKREEKINRVKELENECLQKIGEKKEREREREKDRMAVDKASLERAAVERATVDARLRAMADARERLEKANAEARMKAERAAVERATAEARERALQKAKAGKPNVETREHVERMAMSTLRSDSYQAGGSTNMSTNAYSSAHREVEVESAERCKARLERHQRTARRAAKALEEKNMRDLLAQKELAERNRLAEGLDAEVKRWSSGKEGNLRALLSTLQYILGQNSGWKPIHLTEVITSAAVKKAYRKATLFVHPDKLQQRGASIHEKYVCEKVFDLLKAAWTKFNSEER